MRAGRLRHLVTIQQPADPPPRTTSGAVDREDLSYWEAFGTAFVEMTFVKGDERFAVKQFAAEADWLATGRQTDLRNLTTKMRLVWGSKNLDILAINDPDDGTGSVAIACLEGKSKGN